MARERLDGRNGLIWECYAVKGWTQERIAEQYGMSQMAVSTILDQVRKSIPAPDRSDLISKSVELIHDLQARAYEIIEMIPAPVFVGKDGTIAYDENGKVVRDYTGQIRAMEFAVKCSDTLAKRLGLDAASKTESTMSVKYEVSGVDVADLK